MSIRRNREDYESGDGERPEPGSITAPLDEIHDEDADFDEAPIEDQPYRGEMLGGAAAPVCPGIEPELLRYACFQPGVRLFVIFNLILVSLTIGAFAAGRALHNPGGGWWPGLLAAGFYTIGTLVGLVELLVLLVTVMGYQAAARYFKNALLTPGVVVSSNPLAIVVLAPLGNGTGPEYHGLQRLDLRMLPYHDHAPGTRVPCVSAFVPGIGLDRWVCYQPEPIVWGTGNRAKIDQCFDRLGTEDFDRLDACVSKGLLPRDDDELILLDGLDRQLASLSIREQKEKYPIEAK